MSLLLLPALGFLALALAGCPVTQPQDTPAKEFKATEPVTKAQFYLYVPSDYTPDRRWPLLVTLHGTPGYDSARAQTREWKALAEEHGFIVLAPKLTSVQGILPVPRSTRLRQLVIDERRVLATMEEVKRRYKIDDRPGAVMITGFSAGGFPLYYIALRNPEKFDVLVSRMCNCKEDNFDDISVTDEARKIHILIYFSKTGINPVYSGHSPVARASWAMYRYLRLQKHRDIKIKAIEGGHWRRPEVAYNFWRRYWPKPGPNSPRSD